MNILINASNLKTGGALQVTDSICRDLKRYPQHHFVVVLSQALEVLNDIRNDVIEVYNYNSNNKLKVLLTGRDNFLDQLVKEKNIDIVLSVFGPIVWVPRVPHLCGFARPHLVLTESPFFKRMNFVKNIKNKLLNNVLEYFFRRGVTAFFTENKYISDKWQQKCPKAQVYTITNYYNQVYDQPHLWKNHILPAFDGTTLLCITSYYSHKNLEIAIDIAKYFIRTYPFFKFRFVFTIDEQQFPRLTSDLEKHFCFIGKTNVTEGPSLYQQADITFQPSLLECFTATYPEAMKMEKPIVTTNLNFARGLCEDAALYYEPLSAEDAAETIYKLVLDIKIRQKLIDNGKKQLLKYDNYNQRTDKLIAVLEKIVNEDTYHKRSF